MTRHVERSPMSALPGEFSPLTARTGGSPATEEEALGVMRRRARESGNAVPSALPLPSDPSQIISVRVSNPRVVAVARATAELEGRTLNDAINDFLASYSASAPQSRLTLVSPRSEEVRKDA